jgi:hypothetical protein
LVDFTLQLGGAIRIERGELGFGVLGALRPFATDLPPFSITLKRPPFKQEILSMSSFPIRRRFRASKFRKANVSAGETLAAAKEPNQKLNTGQQLVHPVSDH